MVVLHCKEALACLGQERPLMQLPGVVGDMPMSCLAPAHLLVLLACSSHHAQARHRAVVLDCSSRGSSMWSAECQRHVSVQHGICMSAAACVHHPNRQLEAVLCRQMLHNRCDITWHPLRPQPAMADSTLKRLQCAAQAIVPKVDLHALADDLQ